MLMLPGIVPGCPEWERSAFFFATAPAGCPAGFPRLLTARRPCGGDPDLRLGGPRTAPAIAVLPASRRENFHARRMPATSCGSMTAALLRIRIATSEREQFALHRFRVSLGFARRDAHDQAVRGLPVSTFPPSSHQCQIVADPRWRQCFQLPCHFLCLVIVKITGTKATKKPGTCSVGRAFASGRTLRVRYRLSRSAPCPARLRRCGPTCHPRPQDTRRRACSRRQSTADPPGLRRRSWSSVAGGECVVSGTALSIL
jgi:hypothetical protein